MYQVHVDLLHVAQCSQLLFVAAVVRYVYVRLRHIAKSSQMHATTLGAWRNDHGPRTLVLPVVENAYLARYM